MCFGASKCANCEECLFEIINLALVVDLTDLVANLTTAGVTERADLESIVNVVERGVGGEVNGERKCVPFGI